MSILLAASINAQQNDTSLCRSLYEQGQYNAATECFSKKAFLIEPQGNEAALLQVYSDLGASYVMADEPIMAKAVFGKLLLLSPTYTLDPDRFPPDIISIFQLARKEYLPESYPLRFSFAPGGIPQYKNKEKGKAFTVGAIQALALAASIAGYVNYSSKKSDLYVIAEEDVDAARLSSRMHTIGFVTFSIAYVYSIIDGLIHKPTERTDVETGHNAH
ncbi:MAG: hypothetical protein JNL74_11005 [Fibrobacteres bacterium]|nr:hypothetical protein [Fibrobacterota bacterium]